MNGNRIEIVSKQLDYYKHGLAGCKFAEYAANNPGRSGWNHIVMESLSAKKIDSEVDRAVKDNKINQLSIVLPNIKTKSDLENMVSVLRESKVFFFEEDEEYDGYRLIKLRARILGKIAWVSGFAPLDFLPKTRQSPSTELVLRVKDKPNYAKSIQSITPENELHVANLEVPDMSRKEFTKTWQQSFAGTREILGHNADKLSAAKITYIIPK